MIDTVRVYEGSISQLLSLCDIKQIYCRGKSKMEVVENTELNQPGSDAVEPVVVSQQMDENAMDTTTITKEKAIPSKISYT